MTGRWKTRLLTATILFLVASPILIFATNATQRGPLVSARRAAFQRAGVVQVPDSVRELRRREQQARRHPTFSSAAIGWLGELFWLVIIAVVGRRGFGLRL